MLISNTLDQASDFLSQIKRELQANERLQEDFKDICEPPDSISAAPRWRRDEIITRNEVKVTALGAEKKIRGRRHHQYRPTLIILDDIENESEVRSDEQRKRKQEWFSKAVLKVGTATTNVLVIGTILHYDALLAKLLDRRQSPGWTPRKFQAVCTWSSHQELWAEWESIYCHRAFYKGKGGPKAARAYFAGKRATMLKGTKVLWPQLEDYYALMELRIAEGRASFDSEKQNEPVNPEDCCFQESDFCFWDEEYDSTEALIAAMGNKYSFVGACDPSMGKQGRGSDDSAIITLLRDQRTGTLYVIDADIKRRKPDAIIDDVIAYQRLRKYQRFAMESNQFQKFLSDELRRRSQLAAAYVPVSDLHNSTDKLGRIQRLQPLISSGTLRLSHRHVTLMEQLRRFPLGAHDDGPDALEMAVRMTRPGRGGSFKPIRIQTPRPSIYDPAFHQKSLRRLYGV